MPEVYGRTQLCVYALLIGLCNDMFWMAIGHPAGFWHAQVARGGRGSSPGLQRDVFPSARV